MKAILTFNLPEDDCDFRLASTALQWALVVQDLDNELRKYLKYSHTFKTADEAIESIRDKLFNLLEFRGVSLDMIE